MNASLDIIKDLLKRAGGSIIIDNPQEAFLGLDYEDEIGGEGYRVYATEIHLKDERIYAECDRIYGYNDLYGPTFTKELDLSDIEDIKVIIYRSLVKVDTELGMRVAVLPDLPPYLIKELSHISNPDIRASIASREDIPSEMLGDLLNDSDPFVKGAAMINSIERNLSLLPVNEWVFFNKKECFRYNPEDKYRTCPYKGYENRSYVISVICNAGIATGKQMYGLKDLSGQKHEVDQNELSWILSHIPNEEILDAIHNEIQDVIEFPYIGKLLGKPKVTEQFVEYEFTSKNGQKLKLVDFQEGDKDQILCDSNGKKIFPLYSSGGNIRINKDLSCFKASDKIYPFDIKVIKEIEKKETSFLDKNERFVLLNRFTTFSDSFHDNEINTFKYIGVYDSIIGEEITPFKDKGFGDTSVYCSIFENDLNKAKEWVENYIKKEQEFLSKVLYTYLNTSQKEAESNYPLETSIFTKKFGTARTESDKEKINHFQEYKNILTLIEKYCSLSEAERLELNLEQDTAQKLNYLSMIRENPDCLPNLRLREQEILIKDKQVDYSCNLDSCQAVYPGTQDKLWCCPPYLVTDIEYSTPPYADGKSLNECPGWTGSNADWGHINSITIQNGNGNSIKFTSEMIDKENCLVFEQDDMVVKYGIETGKAEFCPLRKENIDVELPEEKKSSLKIRI